LVESAVISAPMPLVLSVSSNSPPRLTRAIDTRSTAGLLCSTTRRPLGRVKVLVRPAEPERRAGAVATALPSGSIRVITMASKLKYLAATALTSASVTRPTRCV